jgi:UPF0755 protein
MPDPTRSMAQPRWIASRARVLIALSLAGLGAAMAFVTMVWVPYRGYAEEGRLVEVPRGTSVSALARLLRQEGIILSPLAFRTLVWLEGPLATVKAGKYEFRGSTSLSDVTRQLLEGRVVHLQVTIPEGLRLREIVDLLAAQGFGVREELLQAARRAEWVKDLDPGALDLEGYIFPDTYRLASGISAEEVLRPMVERFREVFTGAWKARAAELKMSVRAVVTLASLVEEETGAPEERPLIAAVFHNRLRLRMMLQCDPTVIYALEREGLYRGTLSRKDLRYDSPYNTYVYRTLPPGPISSPGREALQAALYPAASEYLYFVSMNTGRHYFSRHLGEHQRAVQLYQR